ncbi:MAG: hypothetical protein FJW20_26110 [Acidimicrobiia bacterium]|nr:hypothetical protein [Acidimicrobiia bacterium]
MRLNRLVAGVLAGVVCLLGQQFFPLREVKPGMKATGRSVFSGSQVEEFQVEILGVLENAGPKQSIVLGRLSGGPIERTGVMQGMSGSPVYVEGRLLGAVASAFPFSKEPIAGIRPIEEMVKPQAAAAPRVARANTAEGLAALFPERTEIVAGGTRLTDISTPVSFGGFTQRTLEHFAPQLRSLGLEPRQGVLGGGRPAPQMGEVGRLEPGSMISVQLISGDLQVGADGTLTYIDGTTVYGFGHRFISAGTTEMPFARAEVLTLLPNLASSFKISAAREWMGTITGDHSGGVSGELGRDARMTPVMIAVKGGRGAMQYDLRVVRDRFLTPFLLQMAVFSTIDATERAVGAGTLNIRGRLEWEGGLPPVEIRNTFAADTGVSIAGSLAVAAPLSYALQSGFAEMKLERIRLEMEFVEEKRQLHVDQVWTSRQQVRPGETVQVNVVLEGSGGLEVRRQATYAVPLGAVAGPLLITVADATAANLADFQQMLTKPAGSPAQLLGFLNGLRGSDAAYLRIGRQDPGFQIQGRLLPDPPPSLALILQRTPGMTGTAVPGTSRLAEIVLPADGHAVTGTKTIQVEIKE